MTNIKAKLLRNPRVVIGSTILLANLAIAIFGPYLNANSISDIDISRRLTPPDADHFLGCDLLGRDILLVLFYGAQTSLYISLATVAFSSVLGSVYGLVSGYVGGWVDTVFMRLVDIVMAIPGILVAMVLASLLGAGTENIILAIVATGWTSYARLVRGQVLSLRSRDYVAASKVLGASHLRLMFVHIFPGTWTALAVQSSFAMSGVILTESSLSFLGLGVQDEAATWGSLLSQGRTVLLEAPLLSIAPGLAIMVLVLGFNFLGDGLRDVLDPKTAA